MFGSGYTFVQNCLTGVDNQTWDIGRVGVALLFVVWVVSFLLLVWLTLYETLSLGKPPTVTEFATAVGGMIVALGGSHLGTMYGLNLKAQTEPPSPLEDPIPPLGGD
jgi:hypothetical protein